MPGFSTSYTHHRWRCFTPSFLVLAGITYLSLIKDVPIPELQSVMLADKWGHMVAYLVFAICLAGDCYRARLSACTVYTVASLLPVAYGGLIELIQPHFPPRQGEWADWIADCIGVAVGLMLFVLFYLWNKRRKNRLQHAE